jgi:STE24 endopeptidase
MAWRRARFPLTVIAAVVVAQAAVFLLEPRGGVIAPDPVRAQSYFSEAELERARDFRGPQLVLFGLTLVVQGGVLLLLVRRPPRRVLARLPRRPLLGAAAGGALLALALEVATLPLSAIGRQRALDVGLATRSWPGWAQDVVLSGAIGAGFAAGGAALAVALMRRFPRGWWVAGAAGVVLAGAAYTYAGPAVIDPLFNDFQELPDGRTRDDVLELARRAGLDVGDVLVVDASKRTSAANAYVTGLGHTKRVVLYDTLLERFTRDEIRLVVAHEFAHVHHRDVPNGLLFVLLVAPAGLFAVKRLTDGLAPASSDAGPATAAVLPALALSLAVVVTSTTWVSNQLSRRVEARADSYALRLTAAPEAFLSFERRIALRNVSDPEGGPAITRFLLGTHPPILERLGIGEAYERSREAEGPPPG